MLLVLPPCVFVDDSMRPQRFEMAMNCGTEEASADHVDYKMICEQCGSLTIALPVEAKPSPNAVLSCGRCGAPRGTLQSLRDRSNRTGLSGQGL